MKGETICQEFNNNRQYLVIVTSSHYALKAHLSSQYVDTLRSRDTSQFLPDIFGVVEQNNHLLTTRTKTSKL